MNKILTDFSEIHMNKNTTKQKVQCTVRKFNIFL